MTNHPANIGRIELALDRAWRALHVFHSHEMHANLIILEASNLLETMDADADDWFFIRYGEGGAHVRLRFGVAFARHFDAIAIRMQEFARELRRRDTSGFGVALEGYPDGDGKTYEPGSVVEIDYFPETNRYGGPVAIGENERLFRASSALAVRAIRTVDDKRRRALLANDLMIATCAAAIRSNEQRSEAFFRNYALSWRQMLSADAKPNPAQPDKSATRDRLKSLLRFLKEKREPSTISEKWARELEQSIRHFEQIHSDGLLISPILFRRPANEAELDDAIIHMAYSQMHMFNNRLGFMPKQELAFSEHLAGL